MNMINASPGNRAKANRTIESDGDGESVCIGGLSADEDPIPDDDGFALMIQGARAIVVNVNVNKRSSGRIRDDQMIIRRWHWDVLQPSPLSVL